MTGRALAEIDGASGGSRNALLQRLGHAEFVGIDIQNVRLRVEGWPAPLAPAVGARVHQGIFVNYIRRELTGMVQLTKLRQRPRMRLGPSRCERVFCNELPGEWSRLCRERLFFCSNFAGH